LLAVTWLIAVPREAVALCAGFNQESFTSWHPLVFYGRVVQMEPTDVNSLDWRVRLEVYEVVKGDRPKVLQRTIQMGFSFDWECGYPPPKVGREYLIYANGYDEIRYADEQPSFTTERQLGALAGSLGLLILAFGWRVRARPRAVG
jgi:hypothetical protein